MTQGIADVLGETAGLAESPFAGQVPAVGANYQAFSFQAPRFMLDKQAQRAGAAVPRTDFSPVLKNFMVELQPGGPLTLTATDLELAIIATVSAVSNTLIPADAPSCKAVIPARRLMAILAEAPEGLIQVTVASDTATVTAGLDKLPVHQVSWVLKLGSDGKDYPAVSDGAVQLQEVARKPLLDAIRTVRYAVSKTSPELAQISIATGFDGVVCATACDRNRFARVRLKGFPVPMRIPTVSGAVDTLIKMLADSESDTIRVGATDSKLVFVVGSATLIASKLGKDFPDVEKLMLAPVLGHDQELTVDRSELREALRRVKINADATTSALGMELLEGESTLSLSSRDTTGNRAHEAIPATWTGGKRSIVINHDYLDQMLAAHPAPSCVFKLGKDSGKRRSPLLLIDKESGTTGIITQMSVSKLVGY